MVGCEGERRENAWTDGFDKRLVLWFDGTEQLFSAIIRRVGILWQELLRCKNVHVHVHIYLGWHRMLSLAQL